MNPLTKTPLSATDSAVVFLVHGTRNKRAVEEIPPCLDSLCNTFAQQTGLPLTSVRYSFLEFMAPSLTLVLEDLCQAGKTDIRISPLLLFPGAHYYSDMPEIARHVESQYPNVTITLGQCIGVEEPEFSQILLRKLEPAAALV